MNFANGTSPVKKIFKSLKTFKYFLPCKYNIFETAYKKLLTLGYYKLPYIKKSKTMNLFIFVTSINNKLGSENVGINCEYKKKI